MLDLSRANLSKRSALSETLTHIRLTGRLADLIYSTESTNTKFHAYQFKPAVKILNSDGETDHAAIPADEDLAGGQPLHTAFYNASHADPFDRPARHSSRQISTITMATLDQAL